jgi:glycosyltransferase involved in cell wall biosynthesis
MVDVSVIICSHNPRPHYLARVLEALRHQSLPPERWELLVIDNASQPPLTPETWDLSWHPRARLVREDELGLSAARTRGMCEAAAELLVFVDDDNVLQPDYLSQAVRIGREWPQLGVWGGSIVPEFEVEPPDHLREFQGFLALREIKTPRWSNIMTSNVTTCIVEATPLGAGLCVRANVATAYRRRCEQSAIQITDRQGKTLLSGGDVEICYVACSLGFGMGIFPELKLTHLIPKERISEDYFVTIREATGISNLLLAYKWRGVFPRSPFSVEGLLSVLKNILMNRGIDRRMYLADLRATIKATGIINASQCQKS